MENKDNTLRVLKDKDTDLTFQLDISGVSKLDVRANLIIKTEIVNLMFECKEKDSSWFVTIPKLDSFGFKNTSYDYVIQILVGGYYFEPISSKLVIDSQVKVDGNITKVEQSVDKKEENEEKKQQQPFIHADDFEAKLKRVLTTGAAKTEKEREEKKHQQVNEAVVTTQIGTIESLAQNMFNLTNLKIEKPIVNETDRKVKNILKNINQ